MEGPLQSTRCVLHHSAITAVLPCRKRHRVSSRGKVAPTEHALPAWTRLCRERSQARRSHPHEHTRMLASQSRSGEGQQDRLCSHTVQPKEAVKATAASGTGPRLQDSARALTSVLIQALAKSDSDGSYAEDIARREAGAVLLQQTQRDNLS